MIQVEEIVAALCDRSQSADLLKRDLFAAAVVSFMIEKGFVPHVEKAASDVVDTVRLEALSKHWRKSDGCYEIKFYLKQFPFHSVKLVVTPFGETVLVNLVLVDINMDVYSKCFSLNFVMSPKAESADKIYRNISQLKLDVISNIIDPVRSCVVRHHGYESASLVGLPKEILIQIFMYLTVRDIVNIIRTCTDMQWIKQDQVLWRALLLRDFSSIAIEVPEDMNYMRVYRQEHVRMLDEMYQNERRRRESVLANPYSLHAFPNYLNLL